MEGFKAVFSALIYAALFVASIFWLIIEVILGL